MNDDDFKIVEEQFVQAARRAKEASFDFVEIQAAHEFLLSEMLHTKLNEVNLSKDILVQAKGIINIFKRIYNELKIPMGIRSIIYW